MEWGSRRSRKDVPGRGWRASPEKAQDVSHQSQRDWIGLKQRGAQNRAGRALGEYQSEGVGTDP